MAATNYTPIQLYYSTTASAAPAAGNLVSGELAINITDGKLYYKDNGGNVQVIATKGAGTIGGSNTQIQFNDGGALAGNAAMVFNKATNVTTLTTLNLTNALGATYGGTAQSAYAQGDLLYASAVNTLSKLSIGTVNYILTSTGSVPQWVAPTSVTVQTANNLAGGAAGSVPYQSAADTTTFLAIGAANRVMTSTGSAPQWVTSLTGLTGVSSSSMTNTSLTSGRVVYSGASGVQTDSANLTFNGTTLSAGGFSTTGNSTLVKLVTIGDSSFTTGAVLAAATPAKLYIGTGAVTDGTSAGGATNTLGTITAFGQTQVIATNANVTYTNLATLYVAGAPTAGTNVTITNPYSLYVAGGASYFGGAVTYGAGLTLGGNLLFSPDNTYDIGASGANRPRNLFLAGNATITTDLAVGGWSTLGNSNSDTTAVVGVASVTTTDTYSANSSLAVTRTQNGNGNTGYGLNVNISNTGTPSGNTLFGVYIDAYAGGGAGHTIWGLYVNRGQFFLADSGTVGNGTASSSAAAEITLNSGTGNKYSDVDFAFGGVAKWRFGTNGSDNIQVYNSSAGAVATSWSLATNVMTQQTALVLTKNTAGAAPSFTIDNASNDGGVGTKMYLTNSGTGAKYNWIMGTQLTVNDTLQFVPSTTPGGATYSNATLTLYADGSAAVRNTLYATYGSFGNGGTGTNAGEILLNAGSGVGGKYADIDFALDSTKYWRVGMNGSNNMNIYAFGVGNLLTATSAGVLATYDTSGGTNMVANSTGIGAGDSPATVLGTRALRVYSTAGADVVWKGGASTRSWAMHAGSGGNLELLPSDNTGTAYRTAWDGTGAIGVGVAPDSTRRLYVRRTDDYSSGYNIYAYRGQDNNNTTGVAIRGEVTNTGTPATVNLFALQGIAYESNNASNINLYGLYIDSYKAGGGSNVSATGIYTDRGDNYFNRTSGDVYIGAGTVTNGGKLNVTGNNGIGLRASLGGNQQVIQPWFQDSVAQNTWYTVTTFSNQYEGAFFMLMVGYEYDAGDGNNRFALFTASAAAAYAGGIGTTLVSGSSNLECQVANVGGTYSLQVRQTFNSTATGVFRVMLFRLVGN